MADKFGLSRLDGGMHFTAAVPDGDDLCGTIGDKVAQYFSDLARSVTPENAVPTEEALTVSPESRNCVGVEPTEDSKNSESSEDVGVGGATVGGVKAKKNKDRRRILKRKMTVRGA